MAQPPRGLLRGPRTGQDRAGQGMAGHFDGAGMGNGTNWKSTRTDRRGGWIWDGMGMDTRVAMGQAKRRRPWLGTVRRFGNAWQAQLKKNNTYHHLPGEAVE